MFEKRLVHKHNAELVSTGKPGSSSGGFSVLNDGVKNQIIGQTGTVKGSHVVEAIVETSSLDSLDSGKLFFLESASEIVVTLPVPQEGLNYKFFVAVAPSGVNYSIVSNEGVNNIIGAVHESSGGDGDSETSGADTINFIDGTSVVGDQVNLYCNGVNWFARCFCDAAGGITITTAA